MPTYLIQCVKKENVEQAKKFIEEKGGEITHTYNPNIMPGFDVKFPDDSMTILQENEHIKSVELADGEVKTQ